MQIIPVLDLKNGVVVHAKQGQRERYAPIHSPLCHSAVIEQVIAAYLNLYPFSTFYIADLNAIQGNTEHEALLKHVLTHFPQLTFWIDSGYQSAPHIYQQHANYVPVLGSESYSNAQYLELLSFQKNYILSLDFSEERPLLQHFIRTHPNHTIIAAGGIRDAADIIELRKLGITSALLASALHSGAINTAELHKIHTV
ncbi:MAG: HisA/HisF-related TIM barrel protein [Methylococcales bacterium]|nr:HisA/HisF-related TIM barrel protein [Methylococcales bacterium]